MAHILVAEDDATTREMVGGLLKKHGYNVNTAPDGMRALQTLRKKKFDILLVDIWMPKMSGLGLIGTLRGEKHIPKIIVMTSDKTSDTVLKTLRGQVYQFIAKPIEVNPLLTTVENALSMDPRVPPIEVLSADKNWVELLVPCERSVVGRVQSFLSQLGADLPPDVVEKVGYAFRELLSNAIEWGGHLDPNLKVRISYIRTKKALIYRMDDPGPGFKMEDLQHAALSNPADDPMAHMTVREQKGLRPGGLGLMLTQQMVDELVYNEAHNEVVLIKYL